MSNPELMASLERTVVCLVGSPDPKAAMTTALSFVMEAAGADMAALFEPAGTSLRLSFGHGLPPKFLRQPPLLARADWEGAMIVKHPSGPGPGQRQGPGQGPGPGPDPALEQHARLSGMVTWASLPIAHGDDFYGLFLVASRDLLGFSDQAVEIFSIVSKVLGLVLSGLSRTEARTEASTEASTETRTEAPTS